MKTVAAIGVGNIFETVHHPFFAQTCAWVAVADSAPGRARAAADRHGIPQAFADARAMLDATRPDIVCVCTPNKFHHEMVMLALRHGCHVFCEKPPAMSATEAREMKELAEQKGLVLAYNLHHRHGADVALLKERIEAGALGDIYHCKVLATRRRGIPGWGVFTNRELQGGGPLVDLGVHMLDVALYLMGQPRVSTVLATMYAKIGPAKNKGTLGEWDPEAFSVEDSLFAFLKLENGGTLTLETAFALNMKEKSVMNVLLHGTEAGASLRPLEIYGEAGGELADTTFPHLAAHDNPQVSIARFLEAVDGGSPMLADAATGLYLQTILDGIYQSARTGELVTLW